MNRIIFFSFLLGFASCQETDSSPEHKSVNDKPSSVESSEPIRSYKVIYIENVGWGYQIFEGSKMMVDQKHIPAVQGVVGFDTKEKAEITAKYILHKIENGIFPPTVNPEELDSLGVYKLQEETQNTSNDLNSGSTSGSSLEK